MIFNPQIKLNYNQELKMNKILSLLFIFTSTIFCQAQSTSTPAKNTPKPVSNTPKEKPKVLPEKVIKTEKAAKADELEEVLTPENTQIGNPTANKVEPTRVYDYTNSDLLVKWHELIFELVEQTQGYSPNVASRNMAYINLAAYESILPANLSNISLSDQLQEFHRPDSLNIDGRFFNPAVALNSAVFKLVDKLFISAPYIWMEKVYALNDSVNAHFARQLSPDAMKKSKLYGAKIAFWVYEYSKNDGGHQSFMRTYAMSYKLPICQSCFEINRVADLENTGQLHPKWGENRTFLAKNQEQIDIKPKVEFSIYQNSPFYKMAQEVYDISKQVVPNSEKLQIANFWDDAPNGKYVTAFGHWFSILKQVLEEEKTTLMKGAEAYLRLGVTMNDATISVWKAKYTYNQVRPVTYIRKYMGYGSWMPVISTPPNPEYSAAHGTISASAGFALESVFGKNHSFTDHTYDGIGMSPRNYSSFEAAGTEAGISRLYGGIHYRLSIETGNAQGKKVGSNVLGILRSH